MGLAIQRHRALQASSLVFQHQVIAHPALVFADAAFALQRRQEFVTQER
jgi:hypothetical protein